MIELSDSDEKMAKKLHKESIVIDMHSDIMLDVIRQRLSGKSAVISSSPILATTSKYTLHTGSISLRSRNAILKRTPLKAALR